MKLILDLNNRQYLLDNGWNMFSIDGLLYFQKNPNTIIFPIEKAIKIQNLFDNGWIFNLLYFHPEYEIFDLTLEEAFLKQNKIDEIHNTLLCNGWEYNKNQKAFSKKHYKLVLEKDIYKANSIEELNSIIEDHLKYEKQLDWLDYLYNNGWVAILDINSKICYSKFGKNYLSFEEAIEEQKKDDKILCYSSLQNDLKQNNSVKECDFYNYSSENDIYTQLEDLKKENEELKIKLSLYKQSLDFITASYIHFMNKALELMVK